MKLLFCNVAFRGRSGTETYLADVVPALRARGHDVACLTTRAYPVDTGVGRDLQEAGIPVAQDPRDVPWTPDLIHGHHREPTQRAIDAWPHVPAIFFVHDALAPTDEPLVAPGVVHWVAVDHLCARRLFAMPRERCSVLYNAVDLERFVVTRARPRKRPRRALLFMGHAPAYEFVEVLEQACAKRRLDLDRILLATNEVEAPEAHLGRYDLCFARGRSALEAMASGLGVICCGSEGLGPFVTTEAFDDARRFNFGRALLTEEHGVEAVETRLDRWEPDDVAAVTERVRNECALDQLLDSLEALYAGKASSPR